MTGLPFDSLHRKIQEAITTGDDFVNGVVGWPSDWVTEHEYKGHLYTIKRNSQGHSVWYMHYHIGQVHHYGR